MGLRGLVPLAAFVALAAAAQPARHESRDMELVGIHDLQGRSAYQPVIHRQRDMWIAYVGHHGGRAPNPVTGKEEDSGTSILDVTEPRAPKLVAHIPGEPGRAESAGAQMARVCDGAALPRADKSKTYLLRNFGNAAHEVWDVSDPAKPAFVTRVSQGLRGTHKSWWECDTGIAYLVSGVPAWRTHRMTQVYDLSNPAQPRHIRDYGLVGQQPGASGAVPTELHGMVSMGPRANRIYFGHGTGRGGILQIVDREKLLNGPPEPTAANLLYPQVGRLDLDSSYGAHTTFPVLGAEGGDFVVIVNESLAARCRETLQKVWIADVRNDSAPKIVATWEAAESSGRFCSRGGRFGAHSSNENMTPVYYGRVVFIAYFNAGVRALDVRDPRRPKEIAWFIPAATHRTAGGAIQTNNVEVDDRGYIYIVDRASTGMHILQLAGEARKAANFPR